MGADIRKTSVTVEEIRSEIGRPVDPPTRKAAAIAVIANPCAGRYEQDLTELMDIGAELGGMLGDMCVAALGIRPDEAESYGKAAIVGERGEWEHAAAILHPKLGAPLRKAVEKGAALVPSAKKMGGPGTAIDIPLGHKDAAYVRSHFDGIEVRLADAPQVAEKPSGAILDLVILCSALVCGGGWDAGRGHTGRRAVQLRGSGGAPTRSWWRWPSPIPAARSPGSAA